MLRRFSCQLEPLVCFASPSTHIQTVTKGKSFGFLSGRSSVAFSLIASCGMYNLPPGSLLSRELVVCKQPQVISDQWMILTRNTNATRQRPSWRGCLAFIPYRFKWTLLSRRRESNMENQCSYVSSTNLSSAALLC